MDTMDHPLLGSAPLECVILNSTTRTRKVTIDQILFLARLYTKLRKPDVELDDISDREPIVADDRSLRLISLVQIKKSWQTRRAKVRSPTEEASAVPIESCGKRQGE